jgi:hypothetical protein
LKDGERIPIKLFAAEGTKIITEGLSGTETNYSNLLPVFCLVFGAHQGRNTLIYICYIALIEIKGKVAHCRKTESGKFKTGIMLQGTQEEKIRFVKELIRAYHYQKK